MTLLFLHLLVKSRWFRSNRLLIATYFFTGVAMGCRVTYMLNVGYVGSSMMAYMIFKIGGPADTVVSLLAFLLYMFQFTE